MTIPVKCMGFSRTTPDGTGCKLPHGNHPFLRRSSPPLQKADSIFLFHDEVCQGSSTVQYCRMRKPFQPNPGRPLRAPGYAPSSGGADASIFHARPLFTPFVSIYASTSACTSLLNTRLSSSTSTCTTSPSMNVPSSSFIARGFSISLCMARLSGRAP